MKNLLQSKTIIVGLLEIIIGILLFAQGEIQAGALITSAGIMQTALRLITREAVKFFDEA